MGRFSENDIFKFLELYKRSECLWKCNHKYYRIKCKRNEAYMRIRDAMNLPSVMEVKQKIKSFRDTYASERTKVRRSMGVSRHPFDIYKPKLRWYNLADSFLNNPEGIVKVNCPLTVEDSEARNTINPSNVLPQGSDGVYNLQAPPAYKMVNNNPIVNQHQIPRIHGSDPHQSEQQHNFIPNHQHQSQPNFGYIPRNVYPAERTEIHHPSHQSNEFYHFGMNIAMQLSSLPLVQALNIQTKIQQMLCEERIAHEQGRYEIVYDSGHNQFAEPAESNFVDNPHEEYQKECIALESSPREEDDIKVEFLVDDAAENKEAIFKT